MRFRRVHPITPASPLLSFAPAVPIAVLAAVFLATLPPRSSRSQAAPDTPLFSGLGRHGRAIRTDSAEARRYFNQGLAFLYGFNYDEARRSYETATQLDPDCPMAWWGVAMANGPHYNNPAVPPEHEKTALEAIRRASALSDRAHPVEQALIDAISRRFSDPPKTDRAPLNRAYANAMREVWRRFPNDADAGALFAESMMNLRPWDLWTPAGAPQPGTPEIIATLEAVLKLQPNHPQANHLYIHAIEMSPHPEKAAAAADRLRNLQPALGHMVHMPSHIDVRTGRWKKAVIANEKAIIADNAYRSRRPNQGFYRLYMSHNRHMLAHAAMLRGESRKAIRAMDEMVAAIPASIPSDMIPVLDGFLAMPYEVRIRFGRWDEILALPEIAETYPLARSLRHMARGVAYAAKGEVKPALREQALFKQAAKRVPETSFFGNNPASSVLAVAGPMLDGEILLARKRTNDAIARLRAAVAAEDRLRYDEPPSWINPVRHPLGAALLKANRPAQAEAVYRADLHRLPENGWSLYGLSEALRMRGRTAQARRISDRFASAWQDADTPISSSCMCLPGKSASSRGDGTGTPSQG